MRISASLSLILSFLFFTFPASAGEKITVGGTDYPNAEMTEVSRDGIIFKAEDGSYVTLLWADVSAAQL